MLYNDVIKICKAINTNQHYIDYISSGIRCNCYKDVKGGLRLEVMYLPMHKHIFSDVCNDWDNVTICIWILEHTYELKECLGI